MSGEDKEVNKNSKLDFNDPKLSQGCKKIWSYFLDLVKSNSFQKNILEIRKKYKIPENGFPEAELLEIYGKETDDYEDMFVEIMDICTKYKLFFEDWYIIISEYVLSNEIDSEFSDNNQNVCIVRDLDEDKTKQDDDCDCISCKNRNEIYPIGIKISPYASKRDIIDYIRKNFGLVKSLQERYKNPKIMIGRVRKKKQSIQERNDFIYENRELSINETKKQVEEKFGESLDYEYIGKIRSEEAKKRKEM